MLRSLSALAATFAVAATYSISARAESPNVCAAYAALAVQQYFTNKTIPGCFKGDDGRWHADYNRHYGWCLTTNGAALAAETDYRTNALQGCRHRAYGT